MPEGGVRRAGEVGGAEDPADLGAALVSGRYAARVRESFESGLRSGVSGTPTFFINGTRYLGAVDEEPLMTAIETAEQEAMMAARAHGGHTIVQSTRTAPAGIVAFPQPRSP